MVIQKLAYFLVLIGVLVFVHELGHFLLAKLLGVKVLRFSIGFGPRLIGFTRGETEYRIAALPLGGYVKMAGEVPGEDVTPEEQARSYLAQSPWKRMAIVAAGPAFNLAFPLLVLFGVLVSYPQPSAKVLNVEPGLPAAEAGMRVGDVVTAVEGASVRSNDELRWAIEPRAGKRTAISVLRDDDRVELVVVPVRTGDGARGRGIIGVAPYSPPPIVGVPAGSPVAAAGLRTFDRIVSVDGRPVSDTASLVRALGAGTGAELSVDVLRRAPAGLPGVDLQVPERVSLRLPRQPGAGLAALGLEPPDLYVGRVVDASAAAKAGVVAGDRLLAVDGTPLRSMQQFQLLLDGLREREFALRWRHDGAEREARVRQVSITRKDEATGQESTSLDLGLRGFVPEGEKPAYDRVQLPPGVALSTAAHKLGQVIAQTAGGLAQLLTGRVSLKSVGGPVLIYDVAARTAQEGLDSYLMLMALISVNLGLINLVPIPALDGFQFLSAAWEAVRRRPIPMRAREIANAIGLVALIVLMVLVCVNDFMR